MRNPWICVVIAVSLALTALSCVAGIVATQLTDHDPHAALTTTAATCVGALASFLVVLPKATPPAK